MWKDSSDVLGLLVPDGESTAVLRNVNKYLPVATASRLL
jgi:hypothetical protein